MKFLGLAPLGALFFSLLLALGLELALSPSVSGLGANALWGLSLGMATLIAGSSVLLGLAALASRLKPWLWGPVVGLGLAPAFWLVGDSLAQGGWVSQQSWAPAMAWVAAIGGALAIAVLGEALRRLDRWWVNAALVVLAAVIWGADAKILPGLYPLAHLLLTLLSVLAVLTAAFRTIWASRERLPAWTQWVSYVGLALMVAAPVFWFTLKASVRAELLLRGGIATNMVQHLGKPVETNYLTELLANLDQGTPLSAAPAAKISQVDNILFLFVDTLRFDALPPSRTPQSVIRDSDSPFLNGFLTEECVTFEHVYSQASATHQSIPPTFRSIEAWESPDQNGRALGREFQEAGINTFAVVNNYFFEPRYDVTQALLNGFGRFGVYTVFEQNDVVPITKAMLEEHKDGRFFAWVHFMAMHDAGYNDEYLAGKNLPRKKRYQMSMQWLDRTFKTIVEELEAKGLRDKTAIVIASDHGEGLGDNNIWNHGPTAYEEEVRVPLAICLPQKKAQVIKAGSGNIDLVPTFNELLGLAPNPEHRGRSLLGALQEPHDRTYYTTAYNSKMVAVWHRGQKLIYEPKQNIFMRFDLATDPKEEQNLYGQDTALDEELRRQLFLKNPTLLKSEIKNAGNLQLIAEKLGMFDGSTVTDTLLFLLRLAAASPSKTTDEAAARLLARTQNHDVERWILTTLAKREAIGEALLSKISATPAREKALVRLGAHASVKISDPDQAKALIAKRNDTLLAAWLEWVAVTKAADASWESLILELIKRPLSQEATASLVSLLSKFEKSEALKTFNTEALSHEAEEVRIQALKNVRTFKDSAGLAAVETSLRNQSRGLRERQNAVHAYDALKGAEGLEPLLAVAEADELLSLDIVKVFVRHKDIPRLRKLLAMYPRLKRDIDWEIKRLSKKK